VLEHLVEVGVEGHAVGFETLLGPGEDGGVGVAGGYEGGAWCAVEEVQGVAGAHAAKAGDGDAELADHCSEEEEREMGMGREKEYLGGLEETAGVCCGEGECWNDK
jgi:hypothetical protein